LQTEGDDDDLQALFSGLQKANEMNAMSLESRMKVEQIKKEILDGQKGAPILLKQSSK